MKLQFLDRFTKNSQISNFIKFCQMWVELLDAEGQRDGRTEGRTDGQADMTKLILAFRYDAKASKTCYKNLKSKDKLK